MCVLRRDKLYTGIDSLSIAVTKYLEGEGICFQEARFITVVSMFPVHGGLVPLL